LELAKDEKWLNRVTAAISQHWQKRNARKKSDAEKESEPLMPA
jgi:hypothetical protein